MALKEKGRMQRTDPKAVPCLLLKHVACGGRGEEGEAEACTLGFRHYLLHYPGLDDDDLLLISRLAEIYVCGWVVLVVVVVAGCRHTGPKLPTRWHNRPCPGGVVLPGWLGRISGFMSRWLLAAWRSEAGVETSK